jgi:predicted transcriptional regulator
MPAKESAMTVHISVPLDEDQQARFEEIAAAREEPLDKVVAEALADYLDYDRAFRAAVEEGLAAERAGQVTEFATYAADLRRRMALKIAESEA